MSNEMITQLPTVTNASLSDVTMVVQGYNPPTSQGTSSQETWQQVLNLFIQNLGVATATSLSFNPTTGGIVGTRTGTDASPGYVGEIISSQVLAADAVNLTSTHAMQVTSIELSPGDWDVWGNVCCIASGNNMVYAYGAISTNDSNPPDYSIYPLIQGASNFIQVSQSVFPQQFNVSTTTTVYLLAGASFSTGTAAASGMIIARRVR